MLKTVGQFGLQYNKQAQGTLGIFEATSSLLRILIKSQGQHTKIVSIKDRVQSGTGDEGWTIHIDDSLRYRGWVAVSPIDRSERGDPQGVPLLPICYTSRWHEDVP